MQSSTGFKASWFFKYTLGFVIFTTVVFMVMFNKEFRYHILVLGGQEETMVVSFSSSALLVDTVGCQIPLPNISECVLATIVKNATLYACPKNVSDGIVYVDSNKKLAVNSTVSAMVLEHYKAIAVNQSLKCCVTYFKRFSIEKNDYEYRQVGKCVEIKKPFPTAEEVMRTECHIGKILIYQNVEFYIKPKQDVEARCNAATKISRMRGDYAEDPLSVLIIGIDSVSRLNFLRNFKASYKFLMEDMQAFEFQGYNKVGLNTFPCLLPLLSGKSDKEIRKDCWQGKKYSFDNCTFLFDIFGAAGYRTSFIEDQINIGLFTYLQEGFNRQPADYYGYTFFSAVRSLKRKYSCLQTRSDDEVVVQWAVDFQREFAHKPHFGFHWLCQFTHDSLLGGQNVDPFLVTALLQMKEEALLNNTLLIVLTDHGSRYGTIFDSDLGKYELNLPFLAMVFPEWFKKKYPLAVAALRENARNHLVTMYDLHNTLLDVLNMDFSGQNGSKPSSSKGVSLFREIPSSRTCEQGGIPWLYCSCLKKEIELDVGGDVVLQFADFLVKDMNSRMASSKGACAELALHHVVKARAEYEKSQGVSSNGNRTMYYSIEFETSPGNGSFIGVVKFDVAKDDFKIESDIIRTNQYGNSSYCIDEKKLKPYCFCDTTNLTVSKTT